MCALVDVCESAYKAQVGIYINIFFTAMTHSERELRDDERGCKTLFP